uniref:CUB domain-containing protein n=1 Tax=Glossina morsitans morsitans TaxID=37546 RepID=A0A1B0G3P9_GLOMM
MKLSSSTSCGCRFCCCCYCWIIMLLIFSSIVHVSPVMTNVNNNNNNNDYLQLQEQQQRQLKTKSTTMKVKAPPTLTHTTTTANYMRTASNWFDSRTYEAMQSFAMKERSSAPKTLAVIPEWTTFTILTTGRRIFRPFTTTVTVHSKATTTTTISNDISTDTVSISTMTATKSREQYFISEKSSGALANGVFITASDKMQSKEGQKTLHNSITNHKNMRFIKPTGSYICATKTTTTKRDEISNLNNSITQTSIISNTSNDDDATTNPSSSQITYDVGQRNLIEKPTQRLTRHQDDKAITIPLQSIPLYSITIERQQQHRQNTENGNNSKGNDRQDVATLTTASASASASAPSSASTSTSASRTITITKASRSTQIERKEAAAVQPLNQLRRPLVVTTTTTSSLLQRYARQAADAEQNDKCRMFVEGDPAKNEFYSPEFPNNYTKNINCTRVIVAKYQNTVFGFIIQSTVVYQLHQRFAVGRDETSLLKVEIRDGQYGFSNLIGKYCGRTFPPEITSKERYLWLHFHSDESIEYQGFTAVYEFIDRNRDAPSTDLNCTIEKDGFEGFINSTDVPQEIRETVIRNKIPLDCMWRIQVQDKWKIQVTFLNFKLSKPNDCEVNFLDIFPEQTVMPMRVKNFCGSAGEGITSDSNILHMRFYAEQIAINSTFSILFTAFRDRGSGECKEQQQQYWSMD